MLRKLEKLLWRVLLITVLASWVSFGLELRPYPWPQIVSSAAALAVDIGASTLLVVRIRRGAKLITSGLCLVFWALLWTPLIKAFYRPAMLWAALSVVFVGMVLATIGLALAARQSTQGQGET